MVAGVKAERCRSCAEGTLREGFGVVEDVGQASQPSLSDWLAVVEGQVVLKSAQLLLAEEVEEPCPGAGGGVATGCWVGVGVAEAELRRLIGASLSGIRSA